MTKQTTNTYEQTSLSSSLSSSSSSSLLSSSFIHSFIFTLQPQLGWTACESSASRGQRAHQWQVRLTRLWCNNKLVMKWKSSISVSLYIVRKLVLCCKDVFFHGKLTSAHMNHTNTKSSGHLTSLCDDASHTHTLLFTSFTSELCISRVAPSRVR